MSNVEVVSPFVDRATGKTIRPGDPVPKGLDANRIRNLKRAGCLADAKPQRQPAKGSGDGSFRTQADSKKVAGGDGGDTRGRSKSSGGGRKTSKKSSEDDSGQ